MNDLDSTIRTALESAGARAVAPPFEGVRRRHARSRARRVALTGVATVAAVATAALAVPGGNGEGGEGDAVRPATQAPALETFPEDVATLTLIQQCIDGSPSAKPAPMMQWPVWVSRTTIEECYRAYDVPPPPQADQFASDNPRADGTYTCDPAPDAEEVAIASGRHQGVPWKVVVWEGRNGTWCSSWRTDAPPNTQLYHSDSVDDFGRVGSVRAKLSWTVLEETAGSDVVVWGAVRPEVATVRFVTANGDHEVATVSLPGQPDRRWVGAHVPDVGDKAWHAELLDASGTQIGRWPEKP